MSHDRPRPSRPASRRRLDRHRGDTPLRLVPPPVTAEVSVFAVPQAGTATFEADCLAFTEHAVEEARRHARLAADHAARAAEHAIQSSQHSRLAEDIRAMADALIRVVTS